MPIVGFQSATGQKHSFKEALTLCENGSDEYPYPYPLLKGIVESQQDRGDYISATSLLHCLRGDYLKRREDYHISVESAYPMFRGTLFHALLEENPHPQGQVEGKRLRKFRGIEVGGTFDSLITYHNPKDKKRPYTLQDWKTTKALPKYGAYKSHMQQLNLYRWLLGLSPDEVRMEVVYFTMEGVKVCPLRDGTQKGRGGKAAVNQHQTDEQMHAFLDDKLIKLKASLMSNIPLPYDMVPEDDKWECAYCPVVQKCHDLMVTEREAQWRKNSGMSPGDTLSDLAPEWEIIRDAAIERLKTEDMVEG